MTDEESGSATLRGGEIENKTYDTTKNTDHSFWHSRGYLPHFDSPFAVQHVIFHLADSIPQGAIKRIEAELNLIEPEKRESERRLRLNNLIDAGHGCCVLRHPEVAQMVQETLLKFDDVRYKLFAWVVMPNHVHTLLQINDGEKLPKIIASWKSWTGKQIAIRYRFLTTTEGGAPSVYTKRVWQREYWDRFIRDERHYVAVVNYIHDNPVRAGLVQRAEDWPWSSVSLCKKSGRTTLLDGENEYVNATSEGGAPR